MNTLKMKVLLFLSNTQLHRTLGQAVAIWFVTCLGGCITLFGLGALPFPPVVSLLLSLLFSSPALLIAIPFLYNLRSLPSMLIRIVSAVGIIFFTSAAVTGLVATFFELRYNEVGETLVIFIPFALVSFFSVARKQIQSKTTYA